MAEMPSKYLLFSILKETYGISITKVREVIQYESITPIHESSTFLKGVINLRGKIVPIIDMRAKFDLARTDYSDRTIFIIVDIMGTKDVFNIGIAVDSVHDVREIKDADLEKTPDIGLKLKSHYLYGIAKINEKMVMILNIDKILTTDEVINIDGLESKMAGSV